MTFLSLRSRGWILGSNRESFVIREISPLFNRSLRRYDLVIMKRLLGSITTHPLALNAINLSLLILAYTGFKFTFHSSVADTHAVHEATEIWEGFGTIILGYGVLLEERDSLRKIFGLSTKDEHPAHLCHDYGVIFVMLGVLIETFAWLIKIPNSVLDNQVFEFILLIFAALAAIWAAALQIRFAYRLLKH